MCTHALYTHAHRCSACTCTVHTQISMHTMHCDTYRYACAHTHCTHTHMHTHALCMHTDIPLCMHTHTCTVHTHTHPYVHLHAQIRTALVLPARLLLAPAPCSLAADAALWLGPSRAHGPAWNLPRAGLGSWAALAWPSCPSKPAWLLRSSYPAVRAKPSLAGP